LTGLLGVCGWLGGRGLCNLDLSNAC